MTSWARMFKVPASKLVPRPPRDPSFAFGRLCETLTGALRQVAGRTAKELIPIYLYSVRGELSRTMNGVFTQSVA